MYKIVYIVPLDKNYAPHNTELLSYYNIYNICIYYILYIY